MPCLLHSCFDHIASFIGSLPTHLLFNPRASCLEPLTTHQHHFIARWNPNPGDENTLLTDIVLPFCACGITFITCVICWPASVHCPWRCDSTMPCAGPTRNLIDHLKIRTTTEKLPAPSPGWFFVLLSSWKLLSRYWWWMRSIVLW